MENRQDVCELLEKFLTMQLSYSLYSALVKVPHILGKVKAIVETISIALD